MACTMLLDVAGYRAWFFRDKAVNIRTLAGYAAIAIHGELVKLGVEVSQATVAKYMACRHKPRRRRGALS